MEHFRPLKCLGSHSQQWLLFTSTNQLILEANSMISIEITNECIFYLFYWYLSSRQRPIDYHDTHNLECLPDVELKAMTFWPQSVATKCMKSVKHLLTCYAKSLLVMMLSQLFDRNTNYYIHYIQYSNCVIQAILWFACVHWCLADLDLMIWSMVTVY